MRTLPAREPRLLMCPPDHFGVAYVINPWMEPHVGLSDHALATRQWNDLRANLSQLARIEEIAPARGLPDMVFTANAGFVIEDKAIVSRFFAPARRGEEMQFCRWFVEHGYKIAPWPEDIFFEGAGDALVDASRNVVWCGHGFRSDPQAADLLQEIAGVETQALRLVDPHFYHLDTCLCPLSDGGLIYYPPAFDDASRGKIEARVSSNDRIAVTECDAVRFACNAVEIGGRVILNDASHDLRTRLRARGFETVTTPLGEFLKAGGGAKCLVLQLPR
jgi:N-dimethylarginine dimethylaminohydrolase